MKLSKSKKAGILALALTIIQGCQATRTAISKRNLDVQTRTSTAVFVDPVPKNKRLVYLNIRSSVLEFDRKRFKRYIMDQFSKNDNGYRITDDFEKAQFQMSIFVLNLQKASPNAATKALGVGFVGGVATGAAMGSLSNNPSGLVGGALLGGIVSTVTDALVEDVTYMLVADIQIKEKTKKGVVVKKGTNISAKVSDSGTTTQTVTESSNHKEYRTRIVTTANKVNLEIEEAQPKILERTAYAMAGFF